MEESFYTATVDQCIDTPSDLKIIGYGRVNTSSPEALKAAILRSPVTAVIDSEVIHFLARVSVPEDFIVDSNLIGCNPLGSKTGVVVLLVGYDKDTFTVKGSWGADMGQDGYFKIKIDQI
jgi:C1A family cysteine protease